MTGRCTLSLLALTLCLASCAPTSQPRGQVAQPGPQFAQLQARFAALPTTQAVTALTLTPQPDGGTLVGGELAGRTFALRFPAHWNGESLVFAHGYTFVSDEPDTVPADPVAQDSSAGVLPAAYAQGFAVGQSSYDKRGFAVQSGIERTVALSRLLTALGATRAYIAGGSEGGSITQLATERYPDQFAGALAACGVVGGWEREMTYVVNVRALYNYFAAGTGYELPGLRDATKTAGAGQNQIILTLARLYAAAALRPGGVAAGIINKTASAVPEVAAQPDIGTLGSTLLTGMTGVDDFWAQTGGVFVDNRQTVYHSPLLSDAENAALNRGIQRYGASPAALDTVRKQFAPSGVFKTKLLSVHNVYDPLVPAEHEGWLRGAVQAAGNSAQLSQSLVPTTFSKIPSQLVGFQAANHCGFSREQSALAWNTLRQWVESGVQPVPATPQP